MNQRRVAAIQLFVGIALLCVAAIVYWWTTQIYWIAIYPPPYQKQVLGALPYVISGLGIVLILDAVRRWRTSSKT